MARPARPGVHPGRNNVAHEIRFERGDAEAGFAGAHLVHEATYTTHSQYPGYLEPMATVAELMVSKVEHIIATNDVAGAEALEEIDQEMDRLRRKSFAELLGSDWTHGVEPAVDVALLGRYYERIADHAVSVARRVVFLVTGELPVS